MMVACEKSVLVSFQWICGWLCLVARLLSGVARGQVVGTEIEWKRVVGVQEESWREQKK